MRDLRNELNIECPRAKGAYLENAPKEIWDNHLWCIEPKLDGERVTLQIGGDRSLLVGRNRQDFLKGVGKAKEFRCRNSSNSFLTQVANSYLEGTILDGESTEQYTQRGTPTKTTKMRLINGDFVGYTTWGVLFWRGKDVRGYSEEVRRELAGMAVGILNNPRIRLIPRYVATRARLVSLFDIGLEGAIAKKRDSVIPLTQRTHPYWWKLKGAKDRTIDAFVIGVTEGKEGGSGLIGKKPVPSGRAASLTIAVLRNGRVLEIGKAFNLPEAAVHNALNSFSLFDRKVMELQISGWDGKRVRWPRFVKWREDKSPEDCLFQEQIGQLQKNILK